MTGVRTGGTYLLLHEVHVSLDAFLLADGDAVDDVQVRHAEDEKRPVEHAPRHSVAHHRQLHQTAQRLQLLQLAHVLVTSQRACVHSSELNHISSKMYPHVKHN